jgi:hypothetical protein
METEIKLLRNNDNKDWSDLEWIDEFYRFLQGDCPKTIKLGRGHQPKLSRKKAFAIIWYLQEHFPVFPDNVEQCSLCGELFDSDSDGDYSALEGKYYCGGCEYDAETDYCDYCGDQIWKKDAVKDENLVDFVCKDCYEKEKATEQ